MHHGTQGYFIERARFERRLAVMMIGVGLALGASIWMATVPGLRDALERRLDLKRFGFEGPDQYVRRILLENTGPSPPLTTPAITFVPRETHKGGAEPLHASRRPNARPETRRTHVPGAGDSPEDLLARARLLFPRSAVVQSEDLVIERLVRPTYPPEAQDHGIEGKVALVAHIDTTGRVVQVEMMGSTGERQFEQAATEAVWQCLFRPYRVDGESKEVYAVFRFNFKLRD